MERHDSAPVTPLPIESRARLRLRSLGWALLAASLAAAAALPLVLLDPAFAAGGAIALLDPLLRSAGFGWLRLLLWPAGVPPAAGRSRGRPSAGRPGGGGVRHPQPRGGR